MTPLISEKSNSEKTAPNRPRLYAQKLVDVLRASRRLHRPVDTQRWSYQFEVLLNSHSHQEVEDVLAWYKDNITKEDTPKILSAKTFRMKFNELLTLLGSRPITVKELSKEAKYLYARFQGKTWPTGVDAFLPTIIQRSLDNFRETSTKMRATAASGKNAPMKRYLQERGLLHPSNFVAAWLHDILETTFPGWSGSVQKLIFTKDSPRFLKLGRKWAYQYTHNSLRWDDLIKEIL